MTSRRFCYLTDSRVVILVSGALSLVFLGPTQVAADPSSWTSAGGRQDFSLVTDGRVVGTQTVATVKRFTIDSDVPSNTYGYGIGHITTKGAKNWATYENYEHTWGSGPRQTMIQRVCSIDGHMRLQGQGFQPRGRVTKQYADERVDEFGMVLAGMNQDSRGLALAMSPTAACSTLNPNCVPPPEYLLWECSYDSVYQDQGQPDGLNFNTHSPLERNMYLEATENIAVADHGVVVRSPGPAAADALDIVFRQNQYYVFSAVSPPTICDFTSSAECDSQTPAYANAWLKRPETHKPWPGVATFDNPPLNLKVYDATSSSWGVCLNKGGNGICSPPEQTCGRRLLGWTTAACQEMTNWCWAASVQSTIWNMTGEWPDQCEVVKEGLARSDCPNKGGYLWDIARALIHWQLAPTIPLDGFESFDEVRDAIDHGRPVLVAAKYGSNPLLPPYTQWHSMVIHGYECSNNQEYVHVFNIRNCPPSGYGYTPTRKYNFEWFGHNGNWTILDVVEVDR